MSQSRHGSSAASAARGTARPAAQWKRQWHRNRVCSIRGILRSAAFQKGAKLKPWWRCICDLETGLPCQQHWCGDGRQPWSRLKVLQAPMLTKSAAIEHLLPVRRIPQCTDGPSPHISNEHAAVTHHVGLWSLCVESPGDCACEQEPRAQCPGKTIAPHGRRGITAWPCQSQSSFFVQSPMTWSSSDCFMNAKH